MEMALGRENARRWSSAGVAKGTQCLPKAALTILAFSPSWFQPHSRIDMLGGVGRKEGIRGCGWVQQEAWAVESHVQDTPVGAAEAPSADGRPLLAGA